MVEFGADVEITYVMSGLAREFEDPSRLVLGWLEDAARSGMPVDPRIWASHSPRSSYPACIAVKAAAEQGRAAEERYLRLLREGFMCHRRKLDGPDALVEEARGAGLDTDRFRIDLESHATLEAFAADLEETRALGETGPPALPVLRFDSGDARVGGGDPYEAWREAALAAGAERGTDPPPDVAGALRRFGRMATAELEAVCGLPGPRAGAEAWRLASEWHVTRVPVLFGELWEPAEAAHG
jgi:predicted DsbA family dithiol-disulfide isomerase